MSFRSSGLVALALLTGGALAPSPSSAQVGDFPNKPITFITATVGGVTEPAIRLITQKIGDAHPNMKFIFETKTGAGGTIASDFVAKSKPDGYTLGLPSCSFPVSASVYKTLPFDTVKDFEPVALVGINQLVLLAVKSFPADNLADLVKLAKASPGKIGYGSVGIGSVNHLVGEELKIAAGIDLLHVPYTGSAFAVRGMLTGDQALAILPPTAALDFIGNGQIKALAIVSPVRAATLPNVPIAKDTVPAMQGHECWVGIIAAAGTPKPILDLLHDRIDTALKDPMVAKAVSDIGYAPAHDSREAFGKRIREEVDAYREITKVTKITID